ncbi:MAG TPA: two-component sensor histidine kinase, partial [Rhodocyclaceae bacterium]|nr:two-component sensor histidine kinase [Rhodocyclaceae bacterium]
MSAESVPAMKPALYERIAGRLAASLRARMLALALIPLLVVLPLMILVLVWWGGAAFDAVLRNKVQADLAVADGYFERVRSAIGQNVDAIARSYALVRSPRGVDGDFLQVALDDRRNGFRLDFLNLLDLDGRVLASSGQLSQAQSRGDWPVLVDAREGRSSTAVDVFPAELLAALDPRLAERARIALVPTRNALPTPRTQEDRGLVIHSAAPVYDAGGRLVAVLEGGVLLNQNLDFVDRINA